MIQFRYPIALMTLNLTMSRRPVQSGAALAALIAGLCLILLAHLHGTQRLAIAALIGLIAGIALYHAAFGFTSAWRRFIVDGRGAGLRAQFLLILLTCAVSFPLIESGTLFGRPIHGAVAPFGYAAAFGAFLFGIGMQFGGGCASGTLFSAGGGNSRMLLTLTGFIVGSVIATAHMSFWWRLPHLPAISLIDSLGAVIAFGLTAMIFGLIGWYSIRRERRRHDRLEHPAVEAHLWRGPWRKVWGAAALAFVGIATLVTLSRPWGVTSAFALWGAKIANGLGWDVSQWPYWVNRMGLLERSVFADPTSVMNFGIVIGAFAAASLAGRFAPVKRVGARDVLVSLIGGLLMGYGARLSYGCNIGAYLGGVVSGSLHGWGWLVFGFTGSLAGIRLRQYASQRSR